MDVFVKDVSLTCVYLTAGQKVSMSTSPALANLHSKPALGLISGLSVCLWNNARTSVRQPCIALTLTDISIRLTWWGSDSLHTNNNLSIPSEKFLKQEDCAVHLLKTVFEKESQVTEDEAYVLQTSLSSVNHSHPSSNLLITWMTYVKGHHR